MNFSRKMFFFGALMLFFVAYFPSFSYAENNSSTSDTQSYVEIIKDADIITSDQINVGKISAGSQISVEKIQDGKVYFQWNADQAYINEDCTKLISSSDVKFTYEDGINSNVGDTIETNTYTNVYSYTDPNTVILTLNPEVTYSVTQSDGNYYRIVVGNRSGLIHASEVGFKSQTTANSTVNTSTTNTQNSSTSLVQLDTASNSQTSSESTTATISTTAKPSFSSTDHYFQVTEDNVSIYDNSNGSLKLVGYLTNGQEYSRIADYGDWHQIKFGNGYGYVWKESTIPADGSTIKDLNKGLANTNQTFITTDDNVTVYDNSSGKLVPFSSLIKGIQYPYISDLGDWYQIDIGGRIGYVYKPATKKPFTSTDRYFKVTQDNVSIYDNSTGSLKFVGFLNKGQTYSRVADYGDWNQIKFGNGYGYVWKDSTIPGEISDIKNLNSGLINSSHLFTSTNDLTVYDNSSGSLIPFASLSKETNYPFISDLGDWYQIDVAGRIGYVYKPATTRVFELTDRFFVANSNDISVYDNSSGTLVHVGSLIKGQVYARVADYGDWNQIKFGNVYGYVWKASTAPASADSIKNLNTNLNFKDQYFEANENLTVYDNSSGALVPFAAIDKNSKYPIIDDLGDWYQIDVAGRIGYVYKASTTRVFTPSNLYFKVKDTSVTIYDNSSGSLVSVGSLNQGEVFSRIADFGDWHQIRFGNKYGYVWRDATEVSDDPGAAVTTVDASGISFKALQDLTVYDNSTGSLIPIGTINKDAVYQAISISGDWLKVNLSGRIGYVYKGAVQVLSGALYGKVIVLDAGHGGTDPGASGACYKEKDLTLKTTLTLADILEQNGATVILTRSTDTYLTLTERTDISNNNKADAFICIHYNASNSPSVNGVETYYYSPKDVPLANAVHQGIMGSINLADRGTSFGDFHVIRENTQPAILLELGFITNPTEEQVIASSAYETQVADGILYGLKNYFS